MITERRCTADALPCAHTFDASYAWEDAPMKQGAVAPISLAGSRLDNTRHVCAFFNSDDEEYRVLLPFIKDGFTCGDKAIHIVNPNQHEDHLQRLAAVGIDTAAAQRSAKFDIRTNADAYLRYSRFAQHRMLQVFEQS